MTRFVSRRQVVKGAVAASGLAASGVIVVGCGNPVEPAPIYEVSSRNGDLIDPAGTITLGLFTASGEFRFRDLDPTGAVTLRIAGRSDVLLARVGPDEYIALGSECPHAGCPLGYSKEDDLIECPCHASRFLAHPTADQPVGAVVHPPAKDGPPTYMVSLDASGRLLTITLACAPMNVAIPISAHPTLAQVGGGAVVVPPEAPCPIALFRQDETTIVAISAVCTHTGCTVGFDAGAQDWLCPCHASRFALDGSVLNGPATLPLAPYVVGFDGTTITISS